MVLAGCLLLSGPPPARAGSNTGSGDTVTAVGATIAGLVFVPLIAYGIYRNLPSQQGKPETIFPGEFYVGAYMGASFAPNQDLRYESGAAINNGATITGVNPFTAFSSKFQTGVVGGLRFGYFFKTCPYIGLEADMNFSPNRIKSQMVTVSPAVQGQNQVQLPNNDWVNWTTAGHIVARYGFLKDGDVPFGRLQPYVGVGPALVVMYDRVDSAKNLAIDVMVGLRYMMLKNVSAYVEYKYNHQFDAEMEGHNFFVNGAQGMGKATLNYDLHRIVAGVAYHF
jgi:opacity protein-like surface antigen